MLLQGKKGLVLNVTNRNSIGWGIAEAAVAHGAEVGVGAQNERMLDGVQKLIGDNPAYRLFTIDFDEESQLEQLARDVAATYGKIDFLVHSAAYARREDLSGRFIDTTREGFDIALNVSCFSLVALCKHLEPLFNEDASVMTLSYLGSVRAVGNYNVMGVAKAALESSVRYLAQDLGDRGIRVNALSPGPINTVSARGVKDMMTMVNHVQEKAPLKRAFGPEEVGGNAVWLMSELSQGVSGHVIYVDSGYHAVGM